MNDVENHGISVQSRYVYVIIPVLVVGLLCQSARIPIIGMKWPQLKDFLGCKTSYYTSVNQEIKVENPWVSLVSLIYKQWEKTHQTVSLQTRKTVLLCWRISYFLGKHPRIGIGKTAFFRWTCPELGSMKKLSPSLPALVSASALDNLGMVKTTCDDGFSDWGACLACFFPILYSNISKSWTYP